MSYFYNKNTKEMRIDPKNLIAENAAGEKIRITRPERFSFDSADLDWIKVNNPTEECFFNENTLQFERLLVDSAPESVLFLDDEDPDTRERIK